MKEGAVVGLVRCAGVSRFKGIVGGRHVAGLPGPALGLGPGRDGEKQQRAHENLAAGQTRDDGTM